MQTNEPTKRFSTQSKEKQKSSFHFKKVLRKMLAKILRYFHHFKNVLRKMYAEILHYFHHLGALLSNTIHVRNNFLS